MDKLIGKISEIEASASSIMDSVNHRKAALSDEISRRTAAFDAQLEADTEAKLTALRASLEEDLNSRLAKQEAGAREAVRLLNASYESHHAQYAKQLFEEMIKE